MQTIYKYILGLTALACCPTTQAVAPMDIRFHNETSDTTTITRILVEEAASGLSDGKLMVALAEKFEGKPYVASTLEGAPETLTVNVDEFDCTTFVETVAAMAMTLGEHRTSWIDFAHNLEQLRYRGGRTDGYASRLHYISDWVVDNVHRGNLQEVTDRIANSAYAVKTIDFMSSNADKYPALSDAETLAAVKNTEIGFRMHRFPYIKSGNVAATPLQDGDIVAITTSIKNLDVTHMGIVKIINGKAHLIHASSKAGKVIQDPLPLADYLRRDRGATGIRVIRVK